MLFALTVGGLSQRKVVSWVQRFLGGRLSPATIAAVLARAQEQISERRDAPIPPGRYRALVVDGIYLRPVCPFPFSASHAVADLECHSPPCVDRS